MLFLRVIEDCGDLRVFHKGPSGNFLKAKFFLEGVNILVRFFTREDILETDIGLLDVGTESNHLLEEAHVDYHIHIVGSFADDDSTREVVSIDILEADVYEVTVGIVRDEEQLLATSGHDDWLLALFSDPHIIILEKIFDCVSNDVNYSVFVHQFPPRG